MTISFLFKELESWALTSEDAKTNHPSAGSISFYITEMTGPLILLQAFLTMVIAKNICISWLNAVLKIGGCDCLNVKFIT
jgi:hypothetical protein